MASSSTVWDDSPAALLEVAKTNPGLSATDADFAKALDDNDVLAEFRSQFLFPATPKTATVRTDAPNSIYLCGNSLGLQPTKAKEYVLEEMDKWARDGVEGHFASVRPWVTVDELCVDQMSKIVGATPNEVAVMNTLTANLHLMMISFYRPTATRYKILMEAKAFPSDTHAIASQIKLHGLELDDAMLQMSPREGETYVRTEDIAKVLEEQGDSIALVLFSGVQYYTGQAFEIEKITRLGQEKGCKVGFDLAHAVGNLPLKLHDWGVDFACWCTYKYLNSGPGCIGGCFVHQRYESDTSLKRLAGWWGHRKEDRFLMADEFIPSVGAKGWQLSNPPVLPMACIRASLELFDAAGMDRLRTKSEALTGYLELLIEKMITPGWVKVLTPTHKHAAQRGCQLSLVFSHPVKAVHESLTKEGIICDFREPDVIRIAPTPMYNSFTDVHEFVSTLSKLLDDVATSEQ